MRKERGRGEGGGRRGEEGERREGGGGGRREGGGREREDRQTDKQIAQCMSLEFSLLPLPSPGDDDDDDLFSSGSQTKIAPSSGSKTSKRKTTPSHDDDDLFSSGSQSKMPSKPSAKATLSDDDDLFSSGSQTAPSKANKPAKSKGKSPDDDLFSSGSHEAPSKTTKAKSADDNLFSSGSSAKGPSKAAKPTPKAAGPEPEDIDDPLGGGALLASTKVTPSSKTTPTTASAAKTKGEEGKKEKALSKGKKSTPAPLFGSSPETKGEGSEDDLFSSSSSSTKPKAVAGGAGHVTKAPPPKEVASKPVKKNAVLFDDSEGEEDLFGAPKPKSEPSGSEAGPQKEPSPVVTSPRRKPVGAVSMFGGADLFVGGPGTKVEQSEKGSKIAKKREELFSEFRGVPAEGVEIGQEKWPVLCGVVV